MKPTTNFDLFKKKKKGNILVIFVLWMFGTLLATLLFICEIVVKIWHGIKYVTRRVKSADTSILQRRRTTPVIILVKTNTIG